jgi:exonuclease III
VKILSHNTFWFQGVPFLTDQPGSPDATVIKSLCELYRAIDPDVICLQEIQSQQVLDQLSDLLGMQGYYSQGVSYPQYGGAILWRPGRGRLVAESKDTSLQVQRMWQIAEIEDGNSTMRVANVHLPSGRQLGEEGAKKQRVSEIESLTCHFDNPLGVIAGDFNETTSGLVSKYLNQQEYVDCAVHTGCTGTSTLFGARIDYIWLGKQTRDRFHSFSILDPQKNLFPCDGKTHLSDHLPLLLSIE